ncbi:hypothetical protein CDD81_7913 [Ophiocordyceps australis]|uniref:FHA domain-containing protein n=1 Tax=Ophiocordyceps australis TaxID=1399860 RepID=A0A2C5YFQ6_9HYPO|nr:hypothetical protein CDD81_7913 [Ophiocordyceps australis]
MAPTDHYRTRDRNSSERRQLPGPDSRRHGQGRRSRSPDSAARRNDAPSRSDGDGSRRQPQHLARHDGGHQRRGPLPSQQDSYAAETGEAPEKPKEKPNWTNTGVLAAASNSVTQADGTCIALKYHEPAEARKPSPRDEWKLFVFKDGDIVDTIDLNTRSCWLVGREAAVVDILTEHTSISKQHAVIQFRHREKRNQFGDKVGKTKPYLLDLDSANGTALNDTSVPQSRYLELRPKDMIQFGHSTREYVVMLAPRS